MKNTNALEQNFTQPPPAANNFHNGVLNGEQSFLMTSGGQENQSQCTLYLDTAAYHLLRTGFVVRLDEVADQWLLTVENGAAALTGKVDKQVRRRITVTAPIRDRDDALTIKSWPKALRKTVASTLPKHTKVQPILTIETAVEQPASDSVLVQLTEQLLAASRQAPGAPDGVGLHPQLLMADACRLIWREQLMTMLLNEAGVRYSQERDYVHNMRVAIRRARAAAKLYGHFLPRKRIGPYLYFLRKTGQLLGEVRNLDVTLTKARRARTDATAGVPAPKKWVKAWRTQRQAAHEALVAWLDSSEYSDLLAEFYAFCALPTAPIKHGLDAATPHQVRHVIPVQIWEGFAAVRAYETLFETTEEVAPEFLHKLRIACKHLRYNLEFVRHLLGAECEVLITRLKVLQELLGDLNDAVIAQTLVDEIGAKQAVADYQQAQLALINSLRQQAPVAVAALVNQESRTELARALARL